MQLTKIGLSTSVFTLIIFLVSLSSHANAIEQKTHTAKYQSVSVPFKYWSNDTFIINDSKAPIQIRAFETTHVTESHAKIAQRFLKSAGYDDDFRSSIGTFMTEGLELKVSANVVEGKSVQAVKFGFIVIDAFNEHLGGLTGVTMEPPVDEMVWKYRPSYLFKYKKYGKAIVYVRQVRLSGNKIWNFDEKHITTEAQKVVSSFKASNLKIENTK